MGNVVNDAKRPRKEKIHLNPLRLPKDVDPTVAGDSPKIPGEIGTGTLCELD